MPINESITKTERAPLTFGRAVKFRFIGGRRGGDEVPITRETFFIGRSGNNNLVLDDRSVSRKHAVLNYLDGQFILSDLNSFKGTYVNGKKVQETELHNRDRIKIGDILFEFLDGGSIVAVKKRRWLLWPVLLVMVACIIVAAIFLTRAGHGPNQDILREIEYNYSQGIKAYNVEKDIALAKLHWQRVLELDPDGNSLQSRKARVLLENLSSNVKDTESR